MVTQDIRQPIQRSLQPGRLGILQDGLQRQCCAPGPGQGCNIIQEECFQAHPENQQRFRQRFPLQTGILNGFAGGIEPKPDFAVTFASGFRKHRFQLVWIETLDFASDADRQRAGIKHADQADAGPTCRQAFPKRFCPAPHPGADPQTCDGHTVPHVLSNRKAA